MNIKSWNTFQLCCVRIQSLRIKKIKLIKNFNDRNLGGTFRWSGFLLIIAGSHAFYNGGEGWGSVYFSKNPKEMGGGGFPALSKNYYVESYYERVISDFYLSLC